MNPIIQSGLARVIAALSTHRMVVVMSAVIVVAGFFMAEPAYALETDTAGSYKGSEVISLSGLLQMLTGLVLVLLLIFGIAWFVKRFGRFQGAANDKLRLLGGLHLGNRDRIIVVQAEEARLVIGVSPGGIRILHVLPPATGGQDPDGGLPAPVKESFLSRFNQEIMKRGRA